MEGFVKVTGGGVWFRSEGGSDKPPLILVHGGPGSTSDYLHNLLALASDRQVVVYDQLGSGRSDRPRDSGLWTVERFATELAQLRKSLGLYGPIHLYGSSWGTALAVSYALTRPVEPILSMVLQGPYFSTERWDEDNLRLLAAMPTEYEIIKAAVASGRLDNPEYLNAVERFRHKHVCRLDVWPDDLQTTLRTYGREVASTMWGSNDLACEGRLSGWDMTGDLASVSEPTLIMSAEFDLATPYTAGLYQELIPGAELVVFPALSHLPNLEDPETVSQTVANFIARHE